MAPRDSATAQKTGRQSLRRSTRLEDRLVEVSETQQKSSKQPRPISISDNDEDKTLDPAQPPPAQMPSTSSKRKRDGEQQSKTPSPKRPQTSRPRPSLPTPPLQKRDAEQQSKPPSPQTSRPRPPLPTPPLQKRDAITHWARTCRWPLAYLIERGDVGDLFARKKSRAASPRPERLEGKSGTPSLHIRPNDQKPGNEKNAPCQDTHDGAAPELLGTYTHPSERGITAAGIVLCRDLLAKEPVVPKDTIFSNHVFRKACRKFHGRNDARVMQDVARLLVPSAETLAMLGARHLDNLAESVKEMWTNSIPLTNIRPQPDYAVGFGRSAFTQYQLKKLGPFVGGHENSFFTGTRDMYFPFFSSNVKRDADTLEVADQQNAHSMTLSVRGVVELFRLVGREQELHREVVGFSVSHDNRMVRIYAYYPVIEGRKATLYRHPVHKYDFTEEDGKERWTAYKFTKSVYDTWMPPHLKRLCAAIDALPSDVHFELPEASELQFASSGASQGQASHPLSGPGAPVGDKPSFPDREKVAPGTTVTKPSAQATVNPKATK